MNERIVIYTFFACLLEYPTPALKQQAEECGDLLTVTCPPAGDILAGFSASIHLETLSHLEEIYTNTFDLQGTCPPYIGHHLFGESYKRSWFMAKLNEAYRERGFVAENELPDHIAVVLHFLAQGHDDEFSHILRDEGLAPAVQKMIRTFGENDENPYKYVLKALSMFLTNLETTSISDELGLVKGG